jgi:hypothetical protein
MMKKKSEEEYSYISESVEKTVTDNDTEEKLIIHETVHEDDKLEEELDEMADVIEELMNNNESSNSEFGLRRLNYLKQKLFEPELKIVL